MKKKIVTTVLCIALLLAVMAASVACDKNKDTNVGEFTYEINSVAEFKELYNRLGADYDKGTYNLNCDLDLTSEGNWTPVGYDLDHAFTGSFNGNNHTIKYSITKDTPDRTDISEGLEREAYFGLFGCTSGATIKDVKLNVEIAVPIETSRAYVGGLAGYMFGDTKVENIKVSGNISTEISDLREVKVDEFGSTSRNEEGYYMTEYVGGLSGYVIGNSVSVKGVESDIDITAGKCYKAPNDKVRLAELVAGGVLGMARTVNLSSKSNNTFVTVENLTYTGEMEAIGGSVDAGGIIALGYRVNATALVTDVDDMFVSGRDRVNMGAIAGMLDRSTVKKTQATVPVMTADHVGRNGHKRSYNVGGAIGYLANGSKLEIALVSVNIDVARGVNNYTGGIVGLLHFSAVNNAAADGSVVYEGEEAGSTENVAYNNEGKHTEDNYYYIYSGGILGKIYGESSLSNAATTVKAYQGAIGYAMQGVDVVIVEDLIITTDKGAELTDAAIAKWVSASEYADKEGVYCEEVGSDDEKADAKKSGNHKCKLTYRVEQNYNVDNASVYYGEDFASVSVGTYKGDYANGIGTQNAAKYAEMKAAIQAQL